MFVWRSVSASRTYNLQADFDNTPTDPTNPVDSGQGTPPHDAAVAKAIKEGRDPGYLGNKGVMSLWNRERSGRNLQYPLRIIYTR